jgi:photosystem II stability/assembly factor-like uncharacterized protein
MAGGSLTAISQVPQRIAKDDGRMRVVRYERTIVALRPVQRLIGAACATILIALATVALAPPAVSGASPTSTVGAVGSVLTNTSLGGYSYVGEVDMLSPSLGYALAVHPMAKGRYAYYLVRTTNLAKSWTIQSHRLFIDNDFPSLSDFEYDSDPLIDFVNKDVGYVSGPGDGVYETEDAGVAWQRLPTAGSYAVSDSIVNVVSSRCTRSKNGSVLSCDNVMSDYRVGAITPYASFPIPRGGTTGTSTALIAVAAGSQILNLQDNQGPTKTTLLVTHDEGKTWQTLATPCAGIPIDQIIVSPSGTWLLACFLDGGMFQGPARMYHSNDEGATWHSEFADRGTTVYYYFNGNGRIIFGALTNPAGGLTESTDDGKIWSRIQVLGSNGGAPESVSNFAPTSSLYQVAQGPMYVTRNDRTWTLLPQLPAGTYDGVGICTRRDVKATLHRFKSGGLHYAYIDFTNTTSTPCYLDGAPSMQTLGANGRVVGPAITNEVEDASGDFVVLWHRGAVAGIPFMVDSPKSYGASTHCEGRLARWVLVDFSSPSTFKVSLKSPKVSVCTTFQGVSSTQIRLGGGLPTH